MLEEYSQLFLRLLKMWVYAKLYYLLLIVFINFWRYLYRIANAPEDPAARYIMLELFYSSIVIAILFGCGVHAVWMAPFLYKLYMVAGFTLIVKWLV